MKNLPTLLCAVSLSILGAGATCAHADPATASDKPNIVLILADDLGYGDVQCLNPQHGKILTPCLDKLASQGMRLTEAHSSSSVCTPSRYGLLTGRYNWRSRLQRGVMAHGVPPLIDPKRLSFPAMLKKKGYATACVGKWHLGGLIWPKVKGEEDYSKPARLGPTSNGFDWYYGIDTPGFAPHCYIENNQTIVLPTAHCDKKMVRFGGMPGPMAPGFTFEGMLPTLTQKACDYIQEKTEKKTPYFLYYAMTSPHAPISPSADWLGKSGLGRYADFVMETDAMVGKIMQTIEASGTANNTLVIFVSDNGCTPEIGVSDKISKNAVKQLTAKGHFPSGDRRGYKSDIWDGGHHVPCIVRWPTTIKANSQNSQLVCLTDFMATAAEITGEKLPVNAAEDSFSLLSLLKGKDQPIRNSLVSHSVYGRFAIHQGQWKLIEAPGSGGWGYPTERDAIRLKMPKVQLYNMQSDIGERKNLQAQHPEIVARLRQQLKQLVADGRSTPGPKQKNDVPVRIR